MAQYDNDSAPVVGGIVKPGGVGKVTMTDIVEKVFNSGMLCRENVAVSPAGQAVVPVGYLDYRSSLPLFYPGTKGTPTNAKTVYDSLVSITRWLLKVGTYDYYEYKRCSGVGHDKENEWRTSGTALFSDSYAASNVGSLILTPEPGNAGVVSTRIMSVNDIKQLALNCFNSWGSSRKPHYSNTYEYCHNSCHNSCHDSCHDDCHTSGHTDTRSWGCHANGPAYSNGEHYLSGWSNNCHNNCHIP